MNRRKGSAVHGVLSVKTEQKFEDFILHFKGGDRQLECELRGNL